METKTLKFAQSENIKPVLLCVISINIVIDNKYVTAYSFKKVDELPIKVKVVKYS